MSERSLFFSKNANEAASLQFRRRTCSLPPTTTTPTLKSAEGSEGTACAGHNYSRCSLFTYFEFTQKVDGPPWPILNLLA